MEDGTNVKHVQERPRQRYSQESPDTRETEKQKYQDNIYAKRERQNAATAERKNTREKVQTPKEDTIR